MRFYWILKAIGAVAVWTFVLWLDPFGIESETDKASVDLFQRLYAPHYPSDNQYRTFVILITDEDLPISGEGPPRWPPDYDEYATLLNRLTGTSDFRPAAIFIDILYENLPRDLGEIDPLCAALADVRENDVPLVLAQLPDFEKNTLPIPTALQRCLQTGAIISKTPNTDQPGTTGSTASVESGKRDENSVATLDLAAVGWQASEGIYPFAVNISGQIIPTIAARLYEIALRKGDTDAAVPDRFLENAIANQTEMRIAWGANAPFDDEQCVDYGGSAVANLRATLEIFVRGLIPQRGVRKTFDYVQPCAFHEVLSPKDIMAADPDTLAYYQALMADSYLFIGADIDGIPDTVDSPVHGRLPGVFIHSMAFDNMMVFGSAFLRDPPQINLPGGGFDLPADVAIQTALLLILSLTLATTKTPYARSSNIEIENDFIRPLVMGANELIQNLPILLLFVSATLIVSILSFTFLRWSPMNYGGVLLVGTTIIFSKQSTL